MNHKLDMSWDGLTPRASFSSSSLDLKRRVGLAAMTLDKFIPESVHEFNVFEACVPVPLLANRVIHCNSQLTNHRGL
jgi:hypothetical protein